MRVVVREAIYSDYNSVELLLKQIQDIHVRFRPDIYKPVEKIMTIEDFQSTIDSHELFIAIYNEKTVGMISFVVRHIESAHQVTRNILFVDTLVVDENYRSNGIGKTLIEFAVQRKKKMNLDGFELQVNGMNESATRFYEKMGFTIKSVNYELLDK